MKLSTIILFGFTAILVILGLIFKKSKILFLCQIIFAWILLAFNTDSADYIVHLNIFNSVQKDISIISNKGGLYSLICYFFRSNNLEFEIMNILLNTLAMIVLIVIINKLTDKVCFVTSLFFIFPYFNYVIQKRFFLASVIIVLALYFELRNRKGDRIISVILCIVAAQIHVTAYTYLVYIFLFRVPMKKLKKILPIMILLSIILIPVLPKLALIVFPASKVELYFLKLKLGIDDALFWTCFHLLFVLIIYILYKKNKSEGNIFLEKVLKLNLISLIFVSLYYYEPTFFRIFRTLLIFNYICLANMQLNGVAIKKKMFFITNFQICYALFSFIVVHIIVSMGFDKIILPIFESNMIINYIFK